MRQPVEILPWALLSVAALVLSASAADALRRGGVLPVEQTVEASGASAVRIEVHTDASGPIEARRSLTQRRADAIKLYLVDRGVDAATLHSVGMASSVPRRGVDPYAGSNRRVEIVRL